MTENEIFLPMPLEHSRNIFGQFDIFAKKLERGFHISIVNRDEGIKIIGKAQDIQKAEKTISAMDEIIEICDACREWYV